MATKITEEMFQQCIEKNKRFQNLQKIRNSDFLTNPIEIINNNVGILFNYLKKDILTGKANFQFSTLLMTYIFNVLESFSAFKDKKKHLIKDSKITDDEKRILFDTLIDIEGTDKDPKPLKKINIIRNHFHHHQIGNIKMELKISEGSIERKVFVNNQLVVDLFKCGLKDAQNMKECIIKKIDELMLSYDIRENILMFNAYCRINYLNDKVFALLPEETEEELSRYC